MTLKVYDEQCIFCHYNDISSASRHLKSVATRLFVQNVCYDNVKENMKARVTSHIFRVIHRWQMHIFNDKGWIKFLICLEFLTHWGRVTHKCVGKLNTIGWDNGLSPGRRQAIISTNAGILLIGPSGTDFSEILIRIQTFSFKKMHLKMSSAKCRPSCLGLNVLTTSDLLPLKLQQL